MKFVSIWNCAERRMHDVTPNTIQDTSELPHWLVSCDYRIRLSPIHVCSPNKRRVSLVWCIFSKLWVTPSLFFPRNFSLRINWMMCWMNIYFLFLFVTIPMPKTQFKFNEPTKREKNKHEYQGFGECTEYFIWYRSQIEIYYSASPANRLSYACEEKIHK